MEAIAKLKNVPTSPRKMRLVADLIRGQKVSHALNVLKFERKTGAGKLERLLLSAISNWQNKYEDQKLEEADLFIKEIRVDGGRMLKRIRPAAQGRAHRIRKRSNHITLILDSMNKPEVEETVKKEEGKKKKPVSKKEKPSPKAKEESKKKKASKKPAKSKKEKTKKDTKDKK